MKNVLLAILCVLTCNTTLMAAPPPLATPITGTLSVCEASTTALANTTPGGVWTSGTTAVGTVDATTGVVAAISAGTTEITYTVGADFATAIVIVDPLPSPIMGSDGFCNSTSTTYSSASSGVTWSSSDPSIVTIDAITGVATRVLPGLVDIICFFSTTGCSVSKEVTDILAPYPITGPSDMCLAQARSLGNPIGGGVWNSSDAGVASVDAVTGVVTGNILGTATISYTLSAGCFSTHDVTVNPLPAAVTGATAFCAGQTEAYTNTTPAGTWASSTPSVGTIDATTGELTGISAGNTTVSYQMGPGCYSSMIVTVNPTPDAITGTMTVCPTTTETLSSTTIGGSWASGVPTIASVGSGDGVVTGVTPGVVVISYTAGGCYTTTLVTVNALPNPGGISGPAEVCTGSDIAFTNTDPGGVWSSSDISIATVGTGGVVSGIATGTTVISYTVTNACGALAATATVNVIDIPDAGVISGSAGICEGSEVTFTNHEPDGTWSSSDVLVASVGTAGNVLGEGAGTATITYTVGNACGSASTTMDVTVNPLPDGITGLDHVCRTLSTTLTNTSPGGTWSSSSINATVDATTGEVTGVVAGTAFISYTLPTGCVTAIPFTIYTQPAAIAGTPHVCEGATRLLTNSITGGTWSSPDVTVDAGTTTGIISGISAGTATISYTLPEGCFTTTSFTVNPQPGAISGTFVICAGTNSLLTNDLAGGTWSSSNTLAQVGSATGLVYGYMAGTATITYTTTGSCRSTVMVTVLASPAAITGVATVCEGATTTLFNTVPYGVWISDNTAVAEVVVPTGVLGGAGAGTANITYALANGCYRTRVLTVNPLPAVVAGPDNVCTGRTITLTSATPGGTWSSAHSAVGVGSASGIVTGLSTGTAAISYRLPTGCRRVHNVYINPTPTAIAGTGVVCAGSATLLSSTPLTGVWTSGSTGVATVASPAGVVTGVSAGTAIITYELGGTGCSVFTTVTVDPLPDTIAGAATVCQGATTTFASATPGGTWSSASSTVSVGAATGIVTGLAAGTGMVTYTIPTGCRTTSTITVEPLPSAGVVIGASSVCETGTTTLAGSIPGGTWATTTGSASITAEGVVSGVTGGVDTIIYSVTDGCGTATVAWPVTINPLPDPGMIFGPTDLCIGVNIVLAASLPGGTWSNSTTTLATVSATGEVTGISPGTATLSYTRTNSCGSSTATATLRVHAMANAGDITGANAACMDDIITLINGAPDGTWISSSPWIASINSTGSVTGHFPGTTTILYVVFNACSRDTSFHVVTIKTQLECETSVDPSPVTPTSVKVYPNPTNGLLLIESPVAGNLTVYTLDGREVKQYQIAAKLATVSLPGDLAAGIYMIRFAGDDGSSAMARVVYEAR